MSSYTFEIGRADALSIWTCNQLAAWIASTSFRNSVRHLVTIWPSLRCVHLSAHPVFVLIIVQCKSIQPSCLLVSYLTSLATFVPLSEHLWSAWTWSCRRCVSDVFAHAYNVDTNHRSSLLSSSWSSLLSPLFRCCYIELIVALRQNIRGSAE